MTMTEAETDQIEAVTAKTAQFTLDREPIWQHESRPVLPVRQAYVPPELLAKRSPFPVKPAVPEVLPEEVFPKSGANWWEGIFLLVNLAGGAAVLFVLWVLVASMANPTQSFNTVPSTPTQSAAPSATPKSSIAEPTSATRPRVKPRSLAGTHSIASATTTAASPRRVALTVPEPSDAPTSASASSTPTDAPTASESPSQAPPKERECTGGQIKSPDGKTCIDPPTATPTPSAP